MLHKCLSSPIIRSGLNWWSYRWIGGKNTWVRVWADTCAARQASMRAKPAEPLLREHNEECKHKDRIYGLCGPLRTFTWILYAFIFKGCKKSHPAKPRLLLQFSRSFFGNKLCQKFPPTAETVPSSRCLTPSSCCRWDYPSQQADPINTPAHPLINAPLVNH